MQYLCVKQLTAGGKTYNPGNVIPDNVILPERSSRLIKNGYISLINGKMNTFQNIIQISVKQDSDKENEQKVLIPAKPEEIQQVFSVMQLNTEEAAKVIVNITNENVLILLHAADSRKTIKNAAKEQAGKLFTIEGVDT